MSAGYCMLGTSLQQKGMSKATGLLREVEWQPFAAHFTKA
jgi:hypothetical protein